jgi:hypothetical protein
MQKSLQNLRLHDILPVRCQFSDLLGYEWQKDLHQAKNLPLLELGGLGNRPGFTDFGCKRMHQIPATFCGN